MNTTYEIIDLLRIEPQAKHVKTGEIATFPLFHVLIEKIDESEYCATCLEYYQIAIGKTPADATIEIYSNMIDYFLNMINEKGRESIYEVVKTDEYKELWAKIREHFAKQYDEDLKFVEMTLDKNNDISELKEQAKKLKSKHATDYISREAHDEIVGKQKFELESHKKLLKEIIERYNELKKEHENLLEQIQFNPASPWQIIIDNNIKESSMGVSH